MSKQTFGALGVSHQVARALDARGVRTPFPIQALVIGDVLAGRDVLARSPTGSGKTLAFGVPLVDRVDRQDRSPAALVLAPTRELALQIVDELRDLAAVRGLRVAAVYGGAGLTQQARAAARAQIVVATPGRLEDLLARRALTLAHIRALVLDEADRMLDMGFRPAVDRLVAQCPRKRQTLFFSATLAGEAGRLAVRYTKDAVRHDHAPADVGAVDIDHRFRHVERSGRVDALVDELDAPERDLALVFVRTKRGADRLVRKLSREGVDALAIHGDKSQGQRERALARFSSGAVTALVATDVAARGIDIDRVSHVINFDAPADRDGYVHRTGRTARAGRSGIGITFVDGEQARDVEKIASSLGLARQFGATGLRGRPRQRTRAAGRG